MHTFEKTAKEMTLSDILLCQFLVDVLGLSDHLYKIEVIEDLVQVHGSSMNLGHVKSWFTLTPEQELRIEMILHPALQVPSSEDDTRIMHLAEEAEASFSEGKTLVLQLAA